MDGSDGNGRGALEERVGNLEATLTEILLLLESAELWPTPHSSEPRDG